MKTIKIFCLVVMVLSVFSCKMKTEKAVSAEVLKEKFNPAVLQVPDGNLEKLKGQVLYLPIYSNIPYHEETRMHDVSGFIAIHNTDMERPIKVTKVLFFNNDGLLVKDYLKEPVVLQPLATRHYFVPENDKSGTGANFIVEWVAENAVTEPLIESVMISLTSGQGISFTSEGRVLRVMK